MDSTEAREFDHHDDHPDDHPDARVGRRSVPPSTKGVGVSVEVTPRR